MVHPDKVYLIVREVLCQAQFRTRGPKFVLYEGSFKKGLGRWGRTIGPEPKAHLGLGILVSYNIYKDGKKMTLNIERSFQYRQVEFMIGV